MGNFISFQGNFTGKRLQIVSNQALNFISRDAVL